LHLVQITFDRAPIHLDGIAFEVIVFVSFFDAATRIDAPTLPKLNAWLILADQLKNVGISYTGG